MRGRGTVTRKLFFITAAIFATFIIGTLIIQTLFFQKFYLAKKKDELENNIRKFSQSYVKTKDDQEAVNLINDYENNYGYKIVIMDNSGRLKFAVNPTNQREDLFRLRLVYDTIAQLQSNNLLIQAKDKNAIITFTSSIKEMQRTNMVSIMYVPQRDEYVFIINSLQPVSEAVNVISEFYLYFSIVAILLVLILSFVYSNMITKPLIKINRAASKMARLDFSEMCTVKGDDEIGSLAESLNSLSGNLDNALSSLKEANAKLEADIEKERKLEKMRKEFIAAVSHELKTPINLIEGYAEGIKDDIFEHDEMDEHLNIIIDEAKKMANLVADMLDLSQLESGSFKLIMDEFNIDELIRTTVKRFSGLLMERQIDMNMNLIKNVRVYADWDRIEQVITNYITNAIRHTNGSINIEMIDFDDVIRVEVINSGNPIPEKELESIWDKFYKVDKSRNRNLGGTGIGLAIVKNIIALHQGSCGVENVEGGVKFYFELNKCK